MGNGKSFDFPKPPELITYFLQMITKEDDIILDSFAGSGTTAHAVLNLNAADGGNRKFILVEMMDYAESITAERVKRVITGYGEGKNATPGTGGDFAFYDLGEPVLLPDGALNENTPTEKIREYVWFTETGKAWTPPPAGTRHASWLGDLNGAAWYFHYLPGEATALDEPLLQAVKAGEAAGPPERRVIFADFCVIEAALLEAENTVFKKIPRDIGRL